MPLDHDKEFTIFIPSLHSDLCDFWKGTRWFYQSLQREEERLCPHRRLRKHLISRARLLQ